MKLYLISQDINKGYDTYDSAVVSAQHEEDAINIHPYEYVTHILDGKWMGIYHSDDSAIYDGGNEIGDEYEFTEDCWVNYSDISYIKVEYLGKTTRKRGVVMSSFNAG